VPGDWAHADSNGNGNSDGNINPYGHCHCHCHCNCNCNIHAHGNSNSYSHANRDTNGNGHSNSHGDGYTYRACNSDAYTDVHAWLRLVGGSELPKCRRAFGGRLLPGQREVLCHGRTQFRRGWERFHAPIRI
jgi:hypothetical protein